MTDYSEFFVKKKKSDYSEFFQKPVVTETGDIGPQRTEESLLSKIGLPEDLRLKPWKHTLLYELLPKKRKKRIEYFPEKAELFPAGLLETAPAATTARPGLSSLTLPKGPELRSPTGFELETGIFKGPEIRAREEEKPSKPFFEEWNKSIQEWFAERTEDTALNAIKDVVGFYYNIPGFMSKISLGLADVATESKNPVEFMSKVTEAALPEIKKMAGEAVKPFEALALELSPFETKASRERLQDLRRELQQSPAGPILAVYVIAGGLKGGRAGLRSLRKRATQVREYLKAPKGARISTRQLKGELLKRQRQAEAGPGTIRQPVPKGYRFEREASLPTSEIKFGLQEKIRRDKLSRQIQKAKTEVAASEGKVGGIPVKMESSPGKPQDLPSIISDMSKELGVPIRRGFFAGGGKAAPRVGVYKKGPEAIRIKTANDLATASHEVAHHIDKRRGVTKSLSQEVRSELAKLDYDPDKARVSEGFAEFTRHWLTDESAADVAPQTNVWFESFLGKHPELAGTLYKAKARITRWREQGAEARIEATLIRKPRQMVKAGIGEVAPEAWLELRRAVDDNLAPLERYAKEAERKLGRPLLEREDPFQLATAVRNTSRTKALRWFDTATADFDGNVSGPPLKMMYKGVEGREWEATKYAYAKHSLERWSRRKNPGTSKADAQFVVERYRSPEFDAFTDELSAYSDRLLDYVVESGGLSGETAAIFRDAYQNYMPLFREMESGPRPGGPRGRGFADLPEPVKRAIGSGRRVIDPVTSIMIQTERLLGWADRARVGRAIAELAEKTEGIGEWVEKVAVPATATKIKVGDIVKELEKAGVETKALRENPDLLAEYLSFWSVRNRGFPMENIVTFFDREGKAHAYQLKPSLYKAVKQMDGITMPYALQIATLPIRWGKKAITLGATGLRFSFGWGTNLLRDPWIYYLQSKDPRATPVKALKGTAQIVKNKVGYKPGEAWRLFQQQGGEFGTFMNTELPKMMKTSRRLIRDNRRAKALNVVSHPFELYREIVNLPESGPRFAEFEAIYRRRLKETGDHRSAWIAAINASKDVTVNFSRLGYMTQVLNQFIPFFGPQVAGMSKVIRSLKNNPARTVLRGLGMTAATTALWMLNKDEDWYKALPAWDKYGFWHFKLSENPDAPIFRLPKPFEWGDIFGSIPEGILNKMFAEDPDALNEMLGMVWEHITPPIMPAGIGTIVDVTRGEGGYDPFRERAIVPHYQVEQLPPEMRYGRYTTETAKRLGKKLGVSPAKIDYIISGLSGGGALDIVRGVEGVVKPEVETTELPDIPLIGRFVSRSPFLGAFYDVWKKLSDAMAKFKTLQGEAAAEYLNEHPELGFKKPMDDITKTFSQMRRAQEAILKSKSLSGEQKKRQLEELDQRMITMARAFIKIYLQAQKEGIKLSDEQKVRMLEVNP